MRFVKIEQFLRGQWIELIRLPVNNENASEEDLINEVEKFSDMVANAETVSLSNDDTIVVLQASQGPVRFTVDEDRE